MKLNKNGIELMHKFEGLILESYLCPTALQLKKEGKPVFWTIGRGNTFYESGRKVNEGETISQERADRLFLWVAESFARDVRSLLKVHLNENQFSALVSFAYNVGSDIDIDTIPEGLGDSTLLKKVNVNPNDPTIFTEFLKWNKAGGKVSNGLVKRRQAEGNLYYEKL